MGLKNVDALRSFCLELSSDQPSPGGGTASAAAGAVSASLLIMVCGVTGKSKRHIGHWQEIKDLKTALVNRRDGLLRLAKEDAQVYDDLVEASKRRRANDTPGNMEKFQASLRRAAEVPARTAKECCAILEQSVIVAGIQTRNASSDTVVAVMLAEAGFNGASANVDINLRDITDGEFVRGTQRRLKDQSAKVKRLVEEALSRLREQA
jgi:methenyltetrahydrofolate cyclohydrolase